MFFWKVNDDKFFRMLTRQSWWIWFAVNDSSYSNSVFARSLAEFGRKTERNNVYEVEIWRISLLFFSARRVNAFARSEGACKGLFLNPSLRRLGIVALRTVKVLGRWRLVRRRRHRHHRRKIVGAIDKSVVKNRVVRRRRKKCAAASLSQDLPRVPSLGVGIERWSSLLCNFAISLRSDWST